MRARLIAATLVTGLTSALAVAVTATPAAGDTFSGRVTADPGTVGDGHVRFMQLDPESEFPDFNIVTSAAVVAGEFTAELEPDSYFAYAAVDVTFAGVETQLVQGQ